MLDEREIDEKGRRKIEFIDWFWKESMYLKILSDGFKFLEKGWVDKGTDKDKSERNRNYQLAVLTLCELLLKDKWTSFRGYWWFRLA